MLSSVGSISNKPFQFVVLRGRSREGTSNNWKDSIVKGGEASPTLDKLEIYHDGPQTVLDSSHVDLFPILLRC
jgi:hypothetical protein